MTRAADRAYSAIRNLILSGEVAAGAPLREESLAERCGVSRTPVRDALRRLEAELFVVRSDTQRTFVADWSSGDVDEMFTLRAMLESHAAGRAATLIAPEQLAAMRAANRRIEAATARPQPDIQAFLDENRVFHAILLEAAQSPRLTGMLSTLIEQPVVRRTAMTYGREELARSASEHGELLIALEARDATWAQSVMTGHIRRAYHAFSQASPVLSLVSETR